MNLISKGMIQNCTKSAVHFVQKNAPHFLTGTAVVGVGLTSFFAVKGCIRARDILEEERSKRVTKLIKDCKDSNLYPDRDNLPPNELIEDAQNIPKKEAAKLIWKPLLPMLITGATTIACIIGADVVQTGRNAALLAVATASEKALEEYQKNNVKLFGEKAHEKILDQNAKDQVENHEIPEDDLILDTRKGDMIILDEWCGRYFKGSRDEIDKAINALNYDMYEAMGAFNNGYISLNDFYDAIGIFEHTQNGDYLGWDRGHPILVDYRSALKDDEIPVLVLSFKNMPLPDYALEKRV